MRCFRSINKRQPCSQHEHSQIFPFSSRRRPDSIGITRRERSVLFAIGARTERPLVSTMGSDDSPTTSSLFSSSFSSLFSSLFSPTDREAIESMIASNPASSSRGSCRGWKELRPFHRTSSRFCHRSFSHDSSGILYLGSIFEWRSTMARSRKSEPLRLYFSAWKRTLWRYSSGSYAEPRWLGWFSSCWMQKKISCKLMLGSQLRNKVNQDGKNGEWRK